jgi:hypothetical protein
MNDVQRLFVYILIDLVQWRIMSNHAETISGCTINHQNRAYLPTNQTFVTLSCENHGFILVQNLTFGVHRQASTTMTCAYENDDCMTRTTYIGMECNGLTHCNLDLNPQYLHICKSTETNEHDRLFLRLSMLIRVAMSELDVILTNACFFLTSSSSTIETIAMCD